MVAVFATKYFCPQDVLQALLDVRHSMLEGP